MTGQIWLIGGTQESRHLAIALLQAGLPCLVTVTTTAAQSLYPTTPELQVWVGCLTADDLALFIQEHCICAILDASHPFAVEISHLAIAAATQHHLPYLRYERPTVPDASSLCFPDFDRLLATDLLAHQRVLLTVGYRALERFRPWQERATLFARILPSLPALEAAIAAGFTPERLLALRPPISAALEQALWQQWRISLVVTKASGVAGGEAVKQSLAAAMGVTLVTIARPPMVYPQQTDDLALALQFCQAAFHRYPVQKA